jgi:hypothetical protein
MLAPALCLQFSWPQLDKSNTTYYNSFSLDYYDALAKPRFDYDMAVMMALPAEFVARVQAVQGWADNHHQ